jgi:hypothetical protein
VHRISENAIVQQALLKPEFAHLYRGLVPNEWQPANLIVEQVQALSRRGLAPLRLGERNALDTTHFALRGTISAGAGELARELRFVSKRQREHASGRGGRS